MHHACAMHAWGGQGGPESGEPGLNMHGRGARPAGRGSPQLLRSRDSPRAREHMQGGRRGNVPLQARAPVEFALTISSAPAAAAAPGAARAAMSGRAVLSTEKEGRRPASAPLGVGAAWDRPSGCCCSWRPTQAAAGAVQCSSSSLEQPGRATGACGSASGPRPIVGLDVTKGGSRGSSKEALMGPGAPIPAGGEVCRWLAVDRSGGKRGCGLNGSAHDPHCPPAGPSILPWRCWAAAGGRRRPRAASSFAGEGNSGALTRATGKLEGSAGVGVWMEEGSVKCARAGPPLPADRARTESSRARSDVTACSPRIRLQTAPRSAAMGWTGWDECLQATGCRLKRREGGGGGARPK